MEIMTIPTTAWASLPSYAPSFAGPVDETAGVVSGGACRVFGADGDAAPTTQFGADLVRHTAFDFRNQGLRNQGLRNKDIRNKDISTKDTRPGSRAWSPPV